MPDFYLLAQFGGEIMCGANSKNNGAMKRHNGFEKSNLSYNTFINTINISLRTKFQFLSFIWNGVVYPLPYAQTPTGRFGRRGTGKQCKAAYSEHYRGCIHGNRFTISPHRAPTTFCESIYHFTTPRTYLFM